MKEAAVVMIPKEEMVYLDSGLRDHIVKQISHSIADRIVDILDQQEEIIIKQSDLIATEFKPTNSMEYSKTIIWNPLVRCKDCKHYWKNSKDGDSIAICLALPKDDAFCSEGKRREDNA